jgi:hypothetical protein
MGFLDQVNEAIRDIKSNGDFKPLDDGWYDAVVNSAEIRDTRSGGKAVFLTFTTVSPKRNIFHICNVVNSNQKAEEIGKRDLARLALACGIVELTNVDDLCGRGVSILLSTKTDDFGSRNVVKAYAQISNGGNSSTPVPGKKQMRFTDSRPAKSSIPVGDYQAEGPAPSQEIIDKAFDDDIGF